MPQFSVEGMSELLVKLKELPKRLANGAVMEALEAGAKPMLDTAKALAPVKSGQLRDSLKINRANVRKDSYLVRVGTEAGDYKGKTFYGAFVEYGHRIGKRKSHKKMTDEQKAADTRPIVPARPYLRPAFDQNVGGSIEIISRTLGQAIEREASK